jgi:two-component system LytT family sensor kinase
LVENAVRHGLARKPGGGTVTVIAQDHGTEALISVEDDGVGMDADRLETLRDAHRSGAHVGIGNINQRMRSVYGEEYALMVETAPGAGMKVVLRVPKFSPNVRAVMPAYGGGSEDATEITERVAEHAEHAEHTEHTGSIPVARPAHAKPSSTELPAVG